MLRSSCSTGDTCTKHRMIIKQMNIRGQLKHHCDIQMEIYSNEDLVMYGYQALVAESYI